MLDQSVESDFREVFINQMETAVFLRKSSPHERSAKLLKLRSWIKKNQKEIQKALWNDFKKPEVEVDLSEIYPITAEINHALKNLKAWMRPKKVNTPLPMAGTSGKIKFEPKGTSLILSPWNFPFNLTIGPLVSAIAAGCTAIIKPSEFAPATANIISKMISELFEPREIAVFLGDVDIASSLLELPFDHIFFTGSPTVGKIVMKAASKHLSSITLELGGKSPVIIDNSADLKDAAEKIIWGKFMNCGQTCIAPDYILVPTELQQEFTQQCINQIQKYYDPTFKGIEASSDYARIINEKHFNRLIQLLKDSEVKGAKIEFGGKFSSVDNYLEPTLISNISMDMEIFHEEIFGPILPILPYKGLHEAINLVNSKPKPLALYFFGSNRTHQEQVIQETSSGNVVINDCVLHFLHSELPFGGVNNSGIGKAHGYSGFLEFSNPKGILKQRIGFNNVTLLRPPYTLKTKQIIASLIKWF